MSDELWELVNPLLPRKERRFRPPGRGRKLLADRQVLYGIPYVLDNDIPWAHNTLAGTRGWAG
ncbi:transposase [Streptomyces sp. ID38640]|nr:transposase [Streptomyces sp. ID38640]